MVGRLDGSRLLCVGRIGAYGLHRTQRPVLFGTPEECEITKPAKQPSERPVTDSETNESDRSISRQHSSERPVAVGENDDSPVAVREKHTSHQRRSR